VFQSFSRDFHICYRVLLYNLVSTLKIPLAIMNTMRLLDLTLPTPAENLALDEALLEEAETAAEPLETLRFWEPAQIMAVVGRSSRIETEVNLAACRELGIPILRRISGGAAIITGPGCLMYGLVLGYQNRHGLRAINQAHAFVLGTLAQALNSLLPSPDQPSVGARRGAGGEGGVEYTARIAIILSPPALTLSLSQRERGLLMLAFQTRSRIEKFVALQADCLIQPKQSGETNHFCNHGLLSAMYVARLRCDVRHR
jgi:hypothetical protein